jgi:hypothetical protein
MAEVTCTRPEANELGDSFRYSYAPLQESAEPFHWVRMVQLLPATRREEPLRCELQHAELSLALNPALARGDYQEPDYEALSYVWGDDPAPVDRVSFQRGGLDIGRNLSNALRQLRGNQTSRVLWIDAICINQDDIHERSAQVRLMYYIYNRAKQVIIFLGEPSPPPPYWDVKAAFHLAEKLTVFERTSPDLDLRKISLTRRKYETLRLGFPGINSSKYRALRAFFTRPWFGRMWVVQEAACAQRSILVCGGHQMVFAEFMHGTEYGLRSGLFLPAHIRKIVLPVHSEAPRGHLSSAIAMYRLSLLGPQDRGYPLPTVEDSTPVSLLPLLRRFHGSHAGDPRDKLYALLGLASLGPMESFRSLIEDLNMKPDYSLDFKHKDLYQTLAKGILTSTGSMDILSIPSTQDDWPSWVPDWSTTTPETEALSYAAPLSYHSSKSSIAAPTFDGNTLILQGQFIDRITQIVDRTTPANPLSRAYGAAAGSKARSFADILALFSYCMVQVIDWESLEPTAYPTGAPYLDVYQDILFTARSQYEAQWYGVSRRDNRGTERHAKLRRLYEFCRNKAALRGLCFFVLAAVFGSLGFRDFDAEILQSKTFARTSMGYLVLAPVKTRVGDSVAVFRGGKTPLIVGMDGPDAPLRIRGDCYVPGMMEGEVYDEEKCYEIRIT